MDQCLCNFLGGARKVLGREFNDPVQYGGEDKWPIIGQMPRFWLDLEWMPGARQMWDRIKGKNTYILSAVPSSEIVPLCSTQKRQWCERELGISQDRVITVSKRDDKIKFSQYGGHPNLLIDDHLDTCMVWSLHNGHSIWYQTVPETLTELQQFGL